MSDSRTSLLLANLVTAVEEGFSYDRIVSVPEMGLEDAGHRPGLIGSVERGVGLLQKGLKVMGAAVGISRKPGAGGSGPGCSDFDDDDDSSDEDSPNPRDSGIGGPDDEPPPGPSGHPLPILRRDPPSTSRPDDPTGTQQPPDSDPGAQGGSSMSPGEHETLPSAGGPSDRDPVNIVPVDDAQRPRDSYPLSGLSGKDPVNSTPADNAQQPQDPYLGSQGGSSTSQGGPESLPSAGRLGSNDPVSTVSGDIAQPPPPSAQNGSSTSQGGPPLPSSSDGKVPDAVVHVGDTQPQQDPEKQARKAKKPEKQARRKKLQPAPASSDSPGGQGAEDATRGGESRPGGQEATARSEREEGAPGPLDGPDSPVRRGSTLMSRIRSGLSIRGSKPKRKGTLTPSDDQSVQALDDTRPREDTRDQKPQPDIPEKQARLRGQQGASAPPDAPTHPESVQGSQDRPNSDTPEKQARLRGQQGPSVLPDATTHTTKSVQEPQRQNRSSIREKMVRLKPGRSSKTALVDAARAGAQASQGPSVPEKEARLSQATPPSQDMERQASESKEPQGAPTSLVGSGEQASDDTTDGGNVQGSGDPRLKKKTTDDGGKGQVDAMGGDNAQQPREPRKALASSGTPGGQVSNDTAYGGNVQGSGDPRLEKALDDGGKGVVDATGVDNAQQPREPQGVPVSLGSPETQVSDDTTDGGNGQGSGDPRLKKKATDDGGKGLIDALVETLPQSGLPTEQGILAPSNSNLNGDDAQDAQDQPPPEKEPRILRQPQATPDPASSSGDLLQTTGEAPQTDVLAVPGGNTIQGQDQSNVQLPRKKTWSILGSSFGFMP